MIASKVIYDEKIYLADYREQLEPRMSLSRVPQQEAHFLHLLDYITIINPRQYAQYYYALLDVAEAL